MIDRSGQVIGKFSKKDTLPNDRIPVYLALGADGMIFMADQLSNDISVFGPDGEFLHSVRPPELPWGPVGVATDQNGNAYVTDIRPEGQRLLMFDKQLKYTRAISIPEIEPGVFSYPNAVTVDGQGRIYVSLVIAARVDVYAQDGNKVGTISQAGSNAIAMPRGLALDDQDRLLVVDALNGMVHGFDASGSTFGYLFSFGLFGDGDGQFRYPSGIVTDKTGRIYIADTNHDRIQVWSY